jgi:hypothetical protein
MKRVVPSLVLLMALSFLALSCATKPPVKPPEPPQPTVSQADLDSLLAKVQALKKRAFDLKLYEVLPDDYKAADAAYADGKAAYDAKDAATKDKLGKAAALFEDLNSRGIVELASMKRKEADDMRATAVKSGADSAVKDRFDPADASLAAGGAAVEKKDYEAAIAAYERARVLFELAYKRGLAAGLKEKIDTEGYAAWDTGNFQNAEAKFAEEARLYSSLGGPEAAASPKTDPAPLVAGIDALDEAVLRYNLVIQKGRQGPVLGKKAKAEELKQKGDDIKASVAVKDDYAAAQAIYQDGLQALAAGEYEIAGARFDEAAAAFSKVFDIAADKRAKAEAAMKAADDAAAASLRLAQEGDLQVGGSGQTGSGGDAGSTH